MLSLMKSFLPEFIVIFDIAIISYLLWEFGVFIREKINTNKFSEIKTQWKMQNSFFLNATSSPQETLLLVEGPKLLQEDVLGLKEVSWQEGEINSENKDTFSSQIADIDFYDIEGELNEATLSSSECEISIPTVCASHQIHSLEIENEKSTWIENLDWIAGQGYEGNTLVLADMEPNTFKGTVLNIEEFYTEVHVAVNFSPRLFPSPRDLHYKLLELKGKYTNVVWLHRPQAQWNMSLYASNEASVNVDMSV